MALAVDDDTTLPTLLELEVIVQRQVHKWRAVGKSDRQTLDSRRRDAIDVPGWPEEALQAKQ